MTEKHLIICLLSVAGLIGLTMSTCDPADRVRLERQLYTPVYIHLDDTQFQQLLEAMKGTQ
jgi:hypothetical protein